MDVTAPKIFPGTKTWHVAFAQHGRVTHASAMGRLSPVGNVLRFKHKRRHLTMRSPAILSLVLCCLVQAPSEARLFWQTYGSVVPTADGCAWNTNSDYFVPRHCDTGRYGLYSPCKRDCTTSPACRRCHAIYPGYCSPYGCFHYCRRNQIYGRKCGCCPVPYHGPYRPGCGFILSQRGCRGGCAGEICPAGGHCAGGFCAAEPHMICNDCMVLPNVESTEFQILGAISLAGDPLLNNLQLGIPMVPGMPMMPEQIPQASPQAPPSPKLESLPLFGKSPNDQVVRPLSPPLIPSQ